MLFEWYDSQARTVLGRWNGEEEVMEFCPDEKITSIVISVLTSGKSTGATAIGGITFITSLGRTRVSKSVSYGSPGKSVRTRENQHEKLVSPHSAHHQPPEKACKLDVKLTPWQDGLLSFANRTQTRLVVLRCPRSTTAPASLHFHHHPKAIDDRKKNEAERIFWEEIDDSGNKLALSHFEIYYDIEPRNLRGLRLRYGQDVRRDIGEIAGSKASFALENGEQIVRLAVAVSENTNFFGEIDDYNSFDMVVRIHAFPPL